MALSFHNQAHKHHILYVTICHLAMLALWNDTRVYLWDGNYATCFGNTWNLAIVLSTQFARLNACHVLKTFYHKFKWVVCTLIKWIYSIPCSTSDRQGSNFASCVWKTVSSQSSHHPQEVLLAQFSLYVHKGGLKPDSFHFICSTVSICTIKQNAFIEIGKNYRHACHKLLK